jgi:hypothetical protein
MEVYLLIVFIFTITLLFYGINLFFPIKRKLKYYISLGIGIVGVIGWAYLWLRNSWLLATVYGIASIVLAVISFILAMLIDFVVQNQKKLD